MPPPVFAIKLYEMMSDASRAPVCGFSPSGYAFIVYDPAAFARDVLPKFYKHSRMRSFTRQLVQYGFHKRWNKEAGVNEYWHAGFVRGRPDLLPTVLRRNEPLPPKPSVVLASSGSAAGARDVERAAVETRVSLDRHSVAPTPKKARTSSHVPSTTTSPFSSEAAAAAATTASSTTQHALASLFSFAVASHSIEESDDELFGFAAEWDTKAYFEEGEEGSDHALHNGELASLGGGKWEESLSVFTELEGALRTAQVSLAMSEALRQQETAAWSEANTDLQAQVQELNSKLASAEAIVNMQAGALRLMASIGNQRAVGEASSRQQQVPFGLEQE